MNWLRLLKLRIREFMLEAQIDTHNSMLRDHYIRIAAREAEVKELQRRLGKVQTELDAERAPRSLIMDAIARRAK